MTDNIDKQINPEEAQNIFATQMKRFDLTEEEQELAESLGLNDKDLSEMDLFEEESPFSIVDSISLEECAQLNDGSDYYDQVVYAGFTKYELAAYCLEDLYKHIETGEISQQMIDINEKLLCFAENEELINAITCMGIQLSAYNKTQDENDVITSKPGTTGKMMDFHSSLADVLLMRREQDKDVQTTIANEIPLVEDEKFFIQNLMYIFIGIMGRLKRSDKSGYEDKDLFRPAVADISRDVVELHYQFICNQYNQTTELIQKFLSYYQDGEILLDDSGIYTPEFSVFRLAKYVAFEDADYPLPGDENRLVVLDIPDPAFEKSEDENLKEDSDAFDYTISFYKIANNITDDYKRQCMIFSCKKGINSAKNYEKKYEQDYIQIKFAERLLALDIKNEHFMPLYDKLSLDKLYSSANADNSFHNSYDYFSKDLGELLYRAKRAKEKYPNGPGLPSIPLKMKLGFVICAVLAVLAMLIPTTFILTAAETVVKVAFTIIAIIRVIFTGPVAIFVAPFILFVIYFCVMFVLGILSAFISPALLIKLLLIGIPGGFAIYLYTEISNELRKIRESFTTVNSAKTEYKPIAEKLLAICKERNMPGEMVTYYERMVAEFKKL